MVLIQENRFNYTRNSVGEYNSIVMLIVHHTNIRMNNNKTTHEKQQ